MSIVICTQCAPTARSQRRVLAQQLAQDALLAVVCLCSLLACRRLPLALDDLLVLHLDLLRWPCERHPTRQSALLCILTSSVMSASSASPSVVAPDAPFSPDCLNGWPFFARGRRILIVRGRRLCLIAGGGLPCLKSSCVGCVSSCQRQKRVGGVCFPARLAHPVKARVQGGWVLGCCSPRCNLARLRLCLRHSQLCIKLLLLSVAQCLPSFVHDRGWDTTPPRHTTSTSPLTTRGCERVSPAPPSTQAKGGGMMCTRWWAMLSDLPGRALRGAGAYQLPKLCR